MEHKVTVTSPFKSARNPERYAEDPHFQHKLVLMAATTLMEDPFEANVDLRGRQIVVILHEDGLTATAELISVESAALV